MMSGACALWLPVVAALLVVTSAQVIQDCPLGWETWGDQCYHFVFYPVREYTQASAACQLDSAYLLSVNSNDEHVFVSNWLTMHDMNRDNRWWTSGVGDGDTLQWEGDGTHAALDQDDKWTSDNQVNHQPNLHVVYTFTTGTNTFVWSRQPPSKQSPYVCEISAAQAFRINQARRDFTFGTETTDLSLALRGPRFTIVPSKVIVLGKKGSVVLECEADANPKPTYTWFKVGVNSDQAVTPAMDARISVTNGRLSVQNPNEILDAGRYYCQATNSMGTIISHTVAVAFGYLGEFSNDPPGSVRALQYQGTYLECRPPLHNPTVDYQWYRSPGANFVRPSMNQHLFISDNGRLYFSETQMADAGFYHCVVTLDAPLGQVATTGQPPAAASLGIELTILGETATQFGPSIHNDFPAVFPTPALGGNTLRLECFAYGRLPLEYTWRRDNGPIPDKARSEDGGRVLLIPDAQLEDSGNYTCRVERGTRAFDQKSVALSIETVPFFPLSLRDQHVDIGTAFTLLCQAVAVPLPTYTWYKNGQPLTSDPSNVEVKVNVVTFFKADPALHDGMYQCAASNIHGTKMTSAQVRVLEFKPNFRKNPLQSSQMGTVGGNVTILCQPEAAPVPTFTWSHNGRPLSLIPGGPGRVMLLFNGNLLLTQVQLSDQGQYTCTAENSKGSAASSAQLTIIKATTLTMRPSNTEVVGNDTAFLACQASADQTHTDLAYRWTFNGHPIDNKDPHYRQAQHQGANGLYVINAQFKHDGDYRCDVITLDASVSAMARLSVKGPPSEPAGIFGENAGNDVILWWTAGETHGSPIISYVIEFRSNFRPEWRVKVGEVRVTNAMNAAYPDKLTYTIIDLSPGSLYNFRVRAINQFGISAPSLPSSMFKIPDAAPLVAPEGIRNKISTVGTLSFEWDPLSAEDLTGTERGYKLFWRKKAQSVLAESKWETATVDEETLSHVTLVGVENFYLEYEVKIAAFNSLGEGPNSSVAIIMSQEDLPLAVPQNVWGEDLNSSALLVYWDPIPVGRDIMRGKLKGVQVNFWRWHTQRLANKERWFKVHCPEDEDVSQCTSAVVLGLPSASNFWVNVQVFNTAGFGPIGEDAHITTFLDAPLMYPEYVSVASRPGNSVYVQWRGIYIGGTEEALKGYKLWLWPATENMLSANVTVLKGRKQTSTVLDGIQKGTLYALRVLGYSKGGDGKKSPTVYFTLEGGQIRYNPKTTEVLATATDVRASVWILAVTCLCLWLAQ